MFLGDQCLREQLGVGEGQPTGAEEGVQLFIQRSALSLPRSQAVASLFVSPGEDESKEGICRHRHMQCSIDGMSRGHALAKMPQALVFRSC